MIENNININIDGSFIDILIKTIGVIDLIILILTSVFIILLVLIFKYKLSKNEQRYRFRYQLKLARLTQINVNNKIILGEEEKKYLDKNIYNNSVSKDSKVIKIIFSIFILSITLFLIHKFLKKDNN